MVDAFQAEQGDMYRFSANMVLAMQVAMLFEVCGRQSEVGWRDDAAAHNQYRAASCAAFRAMARCMPSMCDIVRPQEIG